MDFGVDRKEYLTTDEDGLKTILETSIGNDFLLKKEVWGFHLLEKRKIRIDFLAHPKEYLIKNNFEPLWFGFEVKSPAVKKEPQKTY